MFGRQWNALYRTAWCESIRLLAGSTIPVLSHQYSLRIRAKTWPIHVEFTCTRFSDELIKNYGIGIIPAIVLNASAVTHLLDGFSI